MTEQLSATVYLFKTVNKKIQVKTLFRHEVQREPLLTIFSSHATALSITRDSQYNITVLKRISTHYETVIYYNCVRTLRCSYVNKRTKTRFSI